MVTMLTRMLLRDMWHMRGLVIAAALVVACGISVFIATRSTYESLLDAQQRYYEQYRFAQIFAHLKRAPASVANDIATLPGVGQLSTRIVMEITLDVPGLAEPATGRLISLPADNSRSLNRLHLQAGRLPDAGQDGEILLSSTFAKANRLKPGDHIEAILNGRWKKLTIVGTALSPEYIYEVGLGMLFPDNRRFGVMWMPQAAMAPAFGMENAFNDLTLTLSPGASADQLMHLLDQQLASYGGLDSYSRKDQLSHQILTDELGEIRVMATIMPTLFLGVAAFLLYIVLSRLVTMQRAEIAQLKAFGYANWQVGLHYLKFALATVALGLVLAIPLGLYLSTLFIDMYREYFHFPHLHLRISPGLLLSATAASSMAAVLGALNAVWHATRLPPAEAMRPEPPPLFHPGWLERSGFIRSWSPGWRMVFRTLLRRRWKAFLSILGIALAVALMLLGRFTIDSARHMLRVQFEQAQRGDIMLLFQEPRNLRVLDELLHLPGVLQVEPYRVAPVRLRHEHFSKRVEVTGLPHDGRLRQIVDMQGKPVTLPADGLILSRKLAEILHVHPGDSIRLEMLQGQRSSYTLKINGLADDMLGLGAYMDGQVMTRLLQEEPQASGAHLRIDSSQATTLYQQLKTLPAVNSIIVRGALQQSIQDSFDRSFVFISSFMFTFAAVIVGGMVYNSVRIALSERGNELASLRVLGFTQREVGLILLGEQALLQVAAVPLGLLIGYGLCLLLVPAFDRELFRLPFVLETRSYIYPALATLAAAGLSGLLVTRRLRQLDMIAVLKTRE